MATTVNFTRCLDEVRAGRWGLVGALDDFGHPVANVSQATAISYGLCVRACGTQNEAFNWNIFSQQFTAWLLPYLALVSQLPFGARTRLQNLVSLLLAVGSPTLAAYSLALTVLNGHWIAERFSHLRYPNVRNAVRILSSLQQSPLEVDKNELASLILLPENDEWWDELVVWLNYVHTWSIAAVASILWVAIAYLFTVVDSFTGNTVTYSSLNTNGQAVGSVFLWLLPIVVSWLQISPKCDHDRVHEALRRANKIAYVATPQGEPTHAENVSSKRAIFLRKGSGSIRCDEDCTSPIFNYARFIPWTLSVEEVYCAFREASVKSERNEPVSRDVTWERGDRHHRVKPCNRRGSLPQVAAYILPVSDAFSFVKLGSRRNRRPEGMVSRFLLASLLAVGLTWGTIGAAILVSYFTPTEGIGCRAGSYIIYGVLSMVVWMLLVASSLIAHFSTPTMSLHGRYLHTATTRALGIASIVIRRVAKMLAALNSVWIVVACLFQFSSFFDRCLCNSSVFSLGSRAFNAIDIRPVDVRGLNVPWIGGVALACGCAVAFMAFVNLFINPVLPEQ